MQAEEAAGKAQEHAQEEHKEQVKGCNERLPLKFPTGNKCWFKAQKEAGQRSPESAEAKDPGAVMKRAEEKSREAQETTSEKAQEGIKVCAYVCMCVSEKCKTGQFLGRTRTDIGRVITVAQPKCTCKAVMPLPGPGRVLQFSVLSLFPAFRCHRTALAGWLCIQSC
eukprot:scaffold151970_cov17-Tisochrysis_lutea.AAC.1